MDKVKIRVWDNFTRLYHFSQLVLLILLWYSAEQAEFELHFICAFTLLAFWLTRLVWGFCGSDTSKFSHFVKAPWTIFKVGKSNLLAPGHVGHNPIAGYMIMALLISLGVQLITGLFASDDVFSEGPLYAYFSEDTVALMDSLHHRNFDLLIVLIGLHAIAGVIHWLRGDNVILAIISGKKAIANTHIPTLAFKSSILPVCLALGLVFSFIYWLLPYASY